MNANLRISALIRGLITIAVGVRRDHAEAVLVFGGIQEVTDERTRRIGIAQWLALERVDPRIQPRFIGIATKKSEILEQDERLIIVGIDNTLVRSESRQHCRTTIRRIVQQADQ